MHEEFSHDELKYDGLPDRITRQTLHHVAIPRQVHFSEVGVVKAHLHTLHNEEESLSGVGQVWRTEDDWRPEELHVRNALMTTEAPMAIRAKHISECHLHSVKRFSDELGHVLICNN